MGQGSLKFLADEDISPALVRIMHHLGEKSVTSIHGTPERGSRDQDWLPLYTQRGYICITCDRKMLVEKSIAATLRQSKATVIFLGHYFRHCKRWDQALRLLRFWPKIKDHAASMKPGDLARVLRNGRIMPINPNP